ncbi:MAG: hypothetical protein A3G25_11160 [Betaproteobacteria bacterium RIFCSPLOWO2_12_FULL_63_13]|nr:MAG: hypothetical protein A3G25_11160 [Betaproteobacteria bacterium RIFCSPLOWO2_12_FULL_63_13]
MKTDDVISMLASGAKAIAPGAPRRRYATALGGGAFGALVLMAIMLGVRPDLAEAARLPMFWVKLAFPAALLAGALLAALRLSRPGVPLKRAPAAIAVPVIAIWLLAAIALFAASPAEREKLLFGATWASCPFNVAILSAPAFIALLWSMKGLAPTRLALAGAAVGLLSGATGAVVYTLHCPEMAAPFLGVWYLLGMLIPTALGAILGPRVLRW